MEKPNNSARPNGHSAANVQFFSRLFSVYQPKSVQMIKMPHAQNTLYVSICDQTGVFNGPSVETINVATMPVTPNRTLIQPFTRSAVAPFCAACRPKRAVNIASGAKQERI